MNDGVTKNTTAHDACMPCRSPRSLRVPAGIASSSSHGSYPNSSKVSLKSITVSLSEPLWLSPNPPWREDSGRGVREDGLGSIGVDGRAADGLSCRTPMAVCGDCDAGMVNTQEGTLADQGGASLRGSSVVRWVARRRRRRQAGSGIRSRARARRPRASSGEDAEAAGRAGDSSGEGEEPPPEGLGGHHRSPRPVRAVQRARLCAITCIASQAALAAKRPDGMWFSPTPYFRSRMAFSTSAWRRWSPAPGFPRPSDEAVIAVGGEEGQLGTQWASPAGQ